MVLLAMIPAAGGAVLVRERLRTRNARVSKVFIASLLVSTVLFVAAGVWPRLMAAVKAQMAAVAAESRAVAEPAAESPALIFLRDHLSKMNIFLNRNYWRYENSRHIYALFLAPEDNRKVMEMFPSRKRYMTVVKPGTDRMEFVPYVDSPDSAMGELAAGLNYVEFDPAKAALAFSRALAERPDEPVLLMNLARAYDLTGAVENKAKAVDLYAKVSRSGPVSVRDMARFLLATDLRQLGRTREALTVYQDLARDGRDPYYQNRAQGWVEKLSR
jgi:tetratricopeptide (TPR) repeat protein